MSKIIGKFEFEDVTNMYESDYKYKLIHLTPSIIYRHKYWYLWEIEFVFWKWNKKIEICRTDWNKHHDKDEKWFWNNMKKLLKNGK